ncbi:MAG: Gfo/Idh/MocA family oxidoreductase [Phycisphaerae bacterium]|nr:Gfo/Idh/MocA family oxidoreductase [Phycisphaerae bacterium]
MVASSSESNSNLTALNRRSFLHTTAAIGATAAFSPIISANSPKKDDINVAILGAGAQGQTLLNACLKMGKNAGVKFKAVCDIWKDNNLKRVSGQLRAYKSYGHTGTAYTDYQEMLDKEKDLDAVIIATPDFWHSRHTIACLNKGLHVYCEKEMANTLQDAREMVLASRKTKKLLQIGHQRRSNPRYIFAYEKLIQEAKLLNRITTINGQWNRSRNACVDLELNPKMAGIDEKTLNKYGFDSMKQFLNWRWYKGKGGGPIVDLGSHQIDIYRWFLGGRPISVMASGGIDYWTEHQWYDNVIAIYEFQTPSGRVRASYQTLTTNSNGGYHEVFMGDQGTLDISEAGSRGSLFREIAVDEEKWDPWVKKGYITKSGGKMKGQEGIQDVRGSIPAAQYDLSVTMDKPYHQPHLENFFEAIRGQATLNCPGEMGYETAVMVLKVNQAVEAGKKLTFKPEDFEIAG